MTVVIVIYNIILIFNSKFKNNKINERENRNKKRKEIKTIVFNSDLYKVNNLY